MKTRLAILALFIGITVHAQVKSAPELPNVLIIGDSISLGYTEPLKQNLHGIANVIHNPGNAEDSANGRARLDAWLGDTKWAVIHFNHGLHDMKYVDANGEKSNTKKNAHVKVPLDEYKANLEAIVARLKETGAALIFATTTPVPEGVKPYRSPDDPAKYNAVALQIMNEQDVTVNDLYSLVLPQLGTIQKPANVHYLPEGSEILAKQVEKFVVPALER